MGLKPRQSLPGVAYNVTNRRIRKQPNSKKILILKFF
jgi:hypothetical protein